MIIRGTVRAIAMSATVFGPALAQAQVAPEFSGARFQINRDRVVVGTMKPCARNATYLVPTVYLNISARTKISAGGGLGNVGTKARVYVQLPNKAELQRMAAAFQGQIVGQMRAAGLTVLTFDDIKGDVAGKPLMTPNPKYGLPTNGSRALPGIDFVVATPSDAQALDYGLTGGPNKPFGDAAKRTGATQLVTEVYLAMPNLGATASKSEGLTWRSSSAKITYAPTLRFGGAIMYGLTAKGAWCSINVPEHGSRMLALNAGTMRDLGSTTDDYGDWSQQRGDFAFVPDNAAVWTGVDAAAKSLGSLITDAMSGKDVKK